LRSLRIAILVGAIVVPAALVQACSDRSTEPPAVAANAPADNTERNERDRNDGSLTPLDQGGSEADRSITQQVRRSVVEQDDLSTNAKNTKIITQDGVVTLRGPVATPEEKTRIAAIAAQTAGVKRVDNQLEVDQER
jgi:hyperosmotically inducible periplasmic protein